MLAEVLDCLGGVFGAADLVLELVGFLLLVLVLWQGVGGGLHGVEVIG